MSTYLMCWFQCDSLIPILNWNLQDTHKRLREFACQILECRVKFWTQRMELKWLDRKRRKSWAECNALECANFVGVWVLNPVVLMMSWLNVGIVQSPVCFLLGFLSPPRFCGLDCASNDGRCKFFFTDLEHLCSIILLERLLSMTCKDFEVIWINLQCLWSLCGGSKTSWAAHSSFCLALCCNFLLPLSF